MAYDLLQQPENTKYIFRKINKFFSNNMGSVSDPAVLWNAHKSFIRGLFIQLGSQARKKRNKKFDDITKKFNDMDLTNKNKPSLTLQSEIFRLRHELRSMLLESYDFRLRGLKANSYATSNKAGKMMANHIKGYRTKTRIPHLVDPVTQAKIINPQKIAEEFSSYYGKLYNLNKDSNTHQPFIREIQSFLSQIELPKLSEEHLELLNAPFTDMELSDTIESLPKAKAPGPDGFTGEYIKSFKTLLIPHMKVMFNHAASTSSFSN